MIGSTISHYKILEKLGEGGMGVVYRAHDTKLDRDVALKFLPANLNASPQDLARFEQEARAISALSHSSIATIFDIDEANDPAMAGKQKFLVLEYIQGGTLKSRLKQYKAEDKQFTISEIVEFGIEIAQGLAHAHQEGIIHRDIKTENLMLSRDGKIKITDFGLARLRGSVHLTKTGSTIGTASYMSPEQLQGNEADSRSDLFSFGVVLYEITTLHLPFRGEHEAALTYSIVNETPEPVSARRTEVPPALEAVINKCLAKDPDKRYQKAEEIVADLRTIQQESSGRVVTQVKSSRLPWFVAAAVVVIAAAVVYLLSPSSRSSGVNGKTIAVLPFTNLTNNKEEEYFSDGITDEILTNLTQIADLNVISRTSTMQFKGTNKTIREIGKELNAGVILEGSVLHVGDQVRITAQLIDANNDKHLWAQTYDREYKQVLAIQSEIAQSIAGALNTRLSPKEAEHLSSTANGNTRTYNLLLQARYYTSRLDSANTVKALDLLQQALAIDSTDARVWAALALALENYSNLASTLSFKDILSQGRNAAQRAVAFDENLAEGHAALASFHMVADWDWQAADREYQRARALEPGNATIIRGSANLAATMGKFDESIRLAQRAIDLDPVNDLNYTSLAISYNYAGRLPEAIAAVRRALELNPNHPAANQLLSLNYLELGKIDSAFIANEREEDPAWQLMGLALANYAVGRKKESDRALDDLIKKFQTGAAYQIAEVYAYRDDQAHAFEWLEKAYENRDPGLSQIKGDPLLRNIEKDPRYKPFMKKMKLDV